MTHLNDARRAFLNERRFAVLGTINPDGTPQLSTMWFELQGDRIMMNTLVGRKKELNLKRDPRLTVCFEDGYTYLTLTGIAELDYDHDRSQATIRALAARYEGEESAESRMQKVFSSQDRVTIYMTIEGAYADGI
jgi:PPOX class probable F420-dependent enzyme